MDVGSGNREKLARAIEDIAELEQDEVEAMLPALFFEGTPDAKTMRTHVNFR